MRKDSERASPDKPARTCIDALDRDPDGRRVLSLGSSSDDCDNPVTI